MASYVKKKIICPCCGRDFSENVLKGFYSEGNVGLDHNPHTPAVFDMVILCPHCGYAAKGFRTLVSEHIKHHVCSEQFQSVRNQNYRDNIYKRIYIAANISEEDKRYKEAADLYLMGYWHSQETDSVDGTFLREAIRCYSIYLESNADINTAITYVDCLRQAERFSDALETIESLSKYPIDDDSKKILIFEYKLIDKRDSSTHFTREALQ